MLDPNEEPKNGTVTVDPDTGEYTYTPDANFNGIESFTILAQENGAIAPEEITLDIQPVNDNPAGTSLDLVSPNGQSVTSGLPVNDVDIATNADRLTYTLASGALNGQVVLDANSGEFTYTPDRDYFGSDTFVIRATDTGGKYYDCQVKVDIRRDGKMITQGTAASAQGGSYPWIYIVLACC
jgi:hypothetical protein